MRATILAVLLAALSLPARAAPAPEAAAIAAIEAIAATTLAAASPLEREVIEADLAFAADARALGVDRAFARWAAPDAKLVGGGASVPTGPAAIAQAFEGGGTGWWWAPIEAHAAGDVGATMGEAVIVQTAADGAKSVTRTRYVTVWRKTAEGWRFVLDMGTPIRD